MCHATDKIAANCISHNTYRFTRGQCSWRLSHNIFMQTSSFSVQQKLTKTYRFGIQYERTFLEDYIGCHVQVLCRSVWEPPGQGFESPSQEMDDKRAVKARLPDFTLPQASACKSYIAYMVGAFRPMLVMVPCDVQNSLQHRQIAETDHRLAGHDTYYFVILELLLQCSSLRFVSEVSSCISLVDLLRHWLHLRLPQNLKPDFTSNLAW